MKLTAVFLFAACLQVSAKTYSQRVSLSGRDIPLEKVFAEIRKQANYVFFYDLGTLKEASPVSIDVKQVTVQQLLDICLKEQPLTFSIQDKTIFIIKKPISAASEISPALPPVSGTVRDEDGNPLSGASIKIKGIQGGATTDAGGNFTIAADPGQTLVISYIGYLDKEFRITSGSAISATLQLNVSSFNEVVVTALGIKREKRNLTYSTQEVKGEELVKSKEPSVVNALTGKVSGVQVTSSSGAPGSSSRIVIRGATSVFGDNQALIVVDGIPINNEETGAIASGAGSSRVIDIDPSTVENINVLKGAAATALYGASGARGVVIITTKGGSLNKKPLIGFSSEVSLDKAILPEFQTKYAQGLNGEYYDGDIRKSNSSYGPLMDTLKINGVSAPRYDPRADFFKTGITTKNTVSVSGGNSNSGYFMSYSYFDQEGIVPTTDFKRHSVFAKYTTKISEKFNSSFQLAYSNSAQNRLPEGSSSESPIFVIYNQPISWNPFPYQNPDGTQRIYRSNRNNPFWGLKNIYNKYGVNRFLPVATFTYTPAKWLTVSERVGADIYMEQDKYKSAPSDVLRTPGQIQDNSINFRQFNHDLIVSANKQFRNIVVNIIAGNNIFSTYTSRYTINGVGLNINDFDNVGSAATINANEKHYLQRKVGFYSQANLEYRKFLAVSLTGRYDGSSVLAADNAFYPYGSAAASFIFSELLPSSSSSVLNFGKLRVSYATVGNDNVGPYSLKTPYTVASVNNIQFPYQGQPGFFQSSTLGNEKLQNERLNEMEIGLEARFLNNRIGIEASYFNRKSSNGIIPGVSIAASTGFDGTTVNSAEIENKGFEFLLNTSPVKTSSLTWDLTFNFTRIRNKVLSLYGDLPNLGRIVVGQPYNIFYGVRFKRNDAGLAYVDGDGLPVTDDLPGILGDANPNWLAGVNSSLRYRRFNFSFFIDMKKGGDIYNETEWYNYFYGTSKVTEDRGNTVYPGINVSDGKPNTTEVSKQELYRYYSDIDETAIQDGTYIKLRTLSLSYDFNKQLLKKTPISHASLTLTGRNLWIYSPHFTSGDPEASTYGNSNDKQGYYGFATPTTRSVNLTLSVNF